MKQLLGTDTAGSYTFNPSAKTVTFSGLARAITLSNILLIILNEQKKQATLMGDVSKIAELDTMIFETETTLTKLKNI